MLRITCVLKREGQDPRIMELAGTTEALVDLSTVAGMVGGGGLGNLAMTYGYNRFDTSVMVVTVVILIVLVQLAQHAGNYFSRRIMRR